MISYSPNKLIGTVLIFGLGGTGARVASLICQQLMSEEATRHARVVLIDGDTVEAKNCKRQLFLPEEIGLNKAEVIADRYRQAFGSNVIAVPSFFPDKDVVLSYFYKCSTSSGYAFTEEETIIGGVLKAMSASSLEEFETDAYAEGDNKLDFQFKPYNFYKKLSAGLTVCILAVDSIPARLSIIDFISSLATIPNIRISGSNLAYGVTSPASNNHIIIPSTNSLVENFVIIDGGNEDVFGQVNYFHPVQFSLCPQDIADLLPERSPYRFATSVVPMPTGRYLNMKEGESTRRCGDLDQTLAINNLVASNMHLIFQNLFWNHEMTFHKISFGLNGAYVTEWMSLTWLKNVITKDPNYCYGTLRSPEKEVNSPEVLLKMPEIDYMKYGGVRRRLNSVSLEREVNPTLIVGNLFGFMFSINGSPGDPSINHKKLPNERKLIAELAEIVQNMQQVCGFYDAPMPGDILKKGLSLFLYTSYLDVSWSELMLPILAKHADKGLFSEGVFKGMYKTLRQYNLTTLSGGSFESCISRLSLEPSSSTLMPTTCIFGSKVSDNLLRVGYSPVVKRKEADDYKLGTVLQRYYQSMPGYTEGEYQRSPGVGIFMDRVHALTDEPEGESKKEYPVAI